MSNTGAVLPCSSLLLCSLDVVGTILPVIIWCSHAQGVTKTHCLAALWEQNQRSAYSFLGWLLMSRPNPVPLPHLNCALMPCDILVTPRDVKCKKGHVYPRHQRS